MFNGLTLRYSEYVGLGTRRQNAENSQSRAGPNHGQMAAKSVLSRESSFLPQLIRPTASLYLRLQRRGLAPHEIREISK